ncbi:uncharacterized protein LOC122650483 [Telopea speciosissima]|uniref:uncharacterized protein LOC122650483 n=1 Tax=Telopea speciosissima TaxID=54955 RepID=UPI001CC7162C|nr:uncharacterized protein LOC122650483 [Telopea speciosissima]
MISFVLSTVCSCFLYNFCYSYVSVAFLPFQRNRKLNGQQKREDLEKEVSMLQKMLDREEKIHQILEHASNRQDGSTAQIPSFLPHKVKELLAELAMVENEIKRLETEISHLQSGLSHEQQETFRESKSIQWQHGTQSINPRRHSSPLRNPTPIPKRIPERQAFDTKALHFISKAIKGDYPLDYFSNNENMSTSKVRSVDQKGNNANEEIELEDKVSRKSGIQKPTSPNLLPKQSTSKPLEHEEKVSLDLRPPKSLSNSGPLDQETGHKWQPNKLSESIMKCLIFIFVRLIRTSRTMELEKSAAGTISKPINSSSSSSRSFRVDISLNSKPNLSLQKGSSRQQDPYGIFDVEDSIPRDIGPYKNFVRFTSTSLDPKNISSSSSIPLLQKLRVLMNNLSRLDLRFLTYQQKLAFWINMYNACIMHGFLQYGVPSSPEKLLTLMNKATLNIGGNQLNALAIEHFILRHRSNSNLKDVYRKGEMDDKEAIVRNIYGLESPEPNVTFALCCGTRFSPTVRIYTAEGISAELEKSKLEYLQASIVVTNTKKVLIPELLLRNMIDFATNFNSLVEWICHQLPASGSLRKSMVECLRGHSCSKQLSNVIDKMPYEFEFQYLLAI